MTSNKIKKKKKHKSSVTNNSVARKQIATRKVEQRISPNKINARTVNIINNVKKLEQQQTSKKGKLNLTKKRALIMVVITVAAVAVVSFSAYQYKQRSFKYSFQEQYNEAYAESQKRNYDKSIEVYHKIAALAKKRNKDEEFVDAKFVEGLLTYFKNMDTAGIISLETNLPNEDSRISGQFDEAWAVLSEITDEPRLKDCHGYPDAFLVKAQILDLLNNENKKDWDSLMDVLIPVADSIKITEIKSKKDIADANRKLNYSTQIASYYLKVHDNDETKEDSKIRYETALKYLNDSKNIMLDDNYSKSVGFSADQFCNITANAVYALCYVGDLISDFDYYRKAIDLSRTALENTSRDYYNTTSYVRLKTAKCEAMSKLSLCLMNEKDNANEYDDVSQELHDDAMSIINGRNEFDVHIQYLVLAGTRLIDSNKFTEDELNSVFKIFNEYIEHSQKNSGKAVIQEKVDYYHRMCLSCVYLCAFFNHDDNQIRRFGFEAADYLKHILYDYATSEQREAIDGFYLIFTEMYPPS